MHKTTRAAEQILVTLLNAVAKLEDNELANRDSVLRFLAAEAPSIGSYLDLDDSVIWSAASISRVVETLQSEERIQRVYAPDSEKAEEILKIVEELMK